MIYFESTFRVVWFKAFTASFFELIFIPLKNRLCNLFCVITYNSSGLCSRSRPRPSFCDSRPEPTDRCFANNFHEIVRKLDDIFSTLIFIFLHLLIMFSRLMTILFKFCTITAGAESQSWS